MTAIQGLAVVLIVMSGWLGFLLTVNREAKDELGKRQDALDHWKSLALSHRQTLVRKDRDVLADYVQHQQSRSALSITEASELRQLCRKFSNENKMLLNRNVELRRLLAQATQRNTSRSNIRKVGKK
jgi:hypothetical protein